MIPKLTDNLYLLAQMVQREVLERYRGSMLGLLWSFALPLLMLGVYMFVFSVVFEIRWGVERESNVDFGVVLFAGLIVHALLSECMTRSPGVITGNAQFVKKVVFPLEILPLVVLGTALFHFIVSVFILLVFVLLSGSGLPVTALWLPVVIAPLVMLTAGISWFLASLSVYLRDIGQLMGIVSTVLLFLSPMFYPITSVPEQWRAWMYLNPITAIIIEVREVTIWGNNPNWTVLGIYSLIAITVMVLGYLWFMSTRRGFADVL
jgi:lipopolysaccharide transport system permease protein